MSEGDYGTIWIHVLHKREYMGEGQSPRCFHDHQRWPCDAIRHANEVEAMAGRVRQLSDALNDAIGMLDEYPAPDDWPEAAQKQFAQEVSDLRKIAKGATP